MSDDSSSNGVSGGPLTVRNLRTRKEKKTYSEDWAYGEEEEIEGVRSFSLAEKLESTNYSHSKYIKEMEGKDFTIAYLQKNGFTLPLLFKDKAGLGLHVPSQKFTVNDVRTCVGSRRLLDVMDVNTQKNFEMTMKEWAKYYDEPVKDKLLNVISLEFSHTKLENYIKRPNIVRELDWVDCVWPKHLKESQTESTNVIDEMRYPKVQKYCLMSVKGCYTDFHIDFGGTSVWYHILKGSKVFWLIPPTENNIKLYEQWILSGKQGDVFFGDIVKDCGRASLNAGDTFFIPTGWIHAVYTPKDSLVFGGNFLHSFGIEKQLRIAEVEESTKVPQKFRYPFFTEMLWYVLERYVYCDLGKSHLSEGVDKSLKSKDPIHFTKMELHGIKAIVRYLHVLPANKKSVPPLITNAIELIRDVAIVINRHKNDKPELAITGKPILKILADKEIERRYKNPGESNAKAKMSRKSGNGTSAGPRRRRTRCKNCEACKRADCGECLFCKDMVKFGGPGRAKQTCVMRQCLQPMLPITAACGICSLDGWGQPVIVPIQKASKDTPSKLMECSICFEIVHEECLSNQPEFDDKKGIVNEDLPSSWECPKCCKEGKHLESKPRYFRGRHNLLEMRRTSVSSNDTNSQKRQKGEEEEEEFSDTHSESDLDNGPNKRLKTDKKENGSTEDASSSMEPRPSEELQATATTTTTTITSSSITATVESTKSEFENKTPHKKFRRNLTEEKKPAKPEPSTSGGGSGNSSTPLVATAAVAPAPEVPYNNDGSKQPKIKTEPPEMNVLEAFAKRDSPSMIKMEAAERPFESANTVADSGVIVTREKMSPIRISEYIPESRISLESSAVISGSVKIEEEIRTNEPIANNVDIPIDEILSNSKKRKHKPKFVIRPVPKLDSDEQDKEPIKRSSTLVPVFKFLSNKDLKSCTLVCKDWYTATIKPILWNRMDFTENVITSKLLKYIMIRQPKVLILDWCKITNEQLSWLLLRLPQSKALSLQGLPWSTVSCLRSCKCPMLTSLNLSFVSSIDDAALQHILSPPLDHRPGLVDLACRLSDLKSLKLAGSEITDKGIQNIVRVLSKLSMLDLTQCHPITDDGVESLTQISGLSTLQLSGCSNITDLSLKHLGKCKTLTYLDVRRTKITKPAVNKFVATRQGFRAYDNKLIVLDKS